MKKDLLSVLIIGLLLITELVASLLFLSRGDQADPEAVGVANQLYISGHYQEAAQIYEQLLAGGMTDSAVYYNLANSYMEQGDIGRAILNYQRAARLEPRDPDIKANLTFARSLSADVFEIKAGGPVQSVSRLTKSWLTLNETAVAALAIWFALAFLIFAFRGIQPGRIRTSIQAGIVLTALLFILVGFSFAARLYMENTQPEGVIVAPEIALSSSPGDEFITEFRLTSGDEVRVSETLGNWVHLSGYDQVLDGWIPFDTIEIISGNLPGEFIEFQS